MQFSEIYMLGLWIVSTINNLKFDSHEHRLFIVNIFLYVFEMNY